MSKTRSSKKLRFRIETLRALDVHQLLDVGGGAALWNALAAAAKQAGEKTILCPSAGGNCQSALANCPSVGGGC